MSYAKLLMRLPFILAGLALGHLWVTAALCNTGYCAFAVLLCATGCAGVYVSQHSLRLIICRVYTAIGVAHASGAEEEVAPRIVLLTLAFDSRCGACVGFALGLVRDCLWLMWRRKARHLPTPLIICAG